MISQISDIDGFKMGYIVNGILATVATAGLLYATVPNTETLREQMADEMVGSGFGGPIGQLVTTAVTSLAPIQTHDCVLFKGALVGDTEYVGILGRWFQLPKRRRSSSTIIVN